MIKKERFSLERKVIATATTEGWKKVPHACFTHEIDITDFLDEVKLVQNKLDSPVGTNIFMLKLIVEGIKEVPEMNASTHFNPFLARGYMVRNEQIDINFPILLENKQMLTIRLTDFGNKKLNEMTCDLKKITTELNSANLERLLYQTILADSKKELKKGNIIPMIGRAFGTLLDRGNKTAKKTPTIQEKVINSLESHMFGKGTITISNIGGLARNSNVRLTLLDIIAPQASAIGINPIQLVNGRKILTLTTAFDHRILDFGEMIPYINKIEEIAKNPDVVHNW